MEKMLKWMNSSQDFFVKISLFCQIIDMYIQRKNHGLGNNTVEFGIFSKNRATCLETENEYK